ncbi:unnamed protein product [Schistosoma mattheei]|uniref:Saposin B-type domain-containing protein n=1 Tax=Schistosoma mattheei TaxID=31246 RepID=A0AA85BH17_9TREM|nr:unnamed protein product [Schistosoma mattheei]
MIFTDKMLIIHILSYLIILDLMLQIDSTREKITSEKWNNLLNTELFIAQTIKLHIQKECIQTLANVSINKKSEISCESFANLIIDLLFQEHNGKLPDKINLNVCTGCKMTVIAVKFVLQLSQVTYYINKFIDQLCLFTGPYLSECSFVAQNYAGILINLFENSTVPMICQRLMIC